MNPGSKSRPSEAVMDWMSERMLVYKCMLCPQMTKVSSQKRKEHYTRWHPGVEPVFSRVVVTRGEYEMAKNNFFCWKACHPGPTLDIKLETPSEGEPSANLEPEASPSAWYPPRESDSDSAVSESPSSAWSKSRQQDWLDHGALPEEDRRTEQEETGSQSPAPTMSPSLQNSRLGHIGSGRPRVLVVGTNCEVGSQRQQSKAPESQRIQATKRNPENVASEDDDGSDSADESDQQQLHVSFRVPPGRTNWTRTATITRAGGPEIVPLRAEHDYSRRDTDRTRAVTSRNTTSKTSTQTSPETKSSRKRDASTQTDRADSPVGQRYYRSSVPGSRCPDWSHEGMSSDNEGPSQYHPPPTRRPTFRHYHRQKWGHQHFYRRSSFRRSPDRTPYRAYRRDNHQGSWWHPHHNRHH